MSAHANRGEGVGRNFTGGQNDNPNPPDQRLYIRQGVALHLKIEEELVAGRPREERRQLAYPIGFGDHQHLGLLLEQRLQALAEDAMVVGNDDTDGLPHRCFTPGAP